MLAGGRLGIEKAQLGWISSCIGGSRCSDEDGTVIHTPSGGRLIRCPQDVLMAPRSWKMKLE